MTNKLPAQLYECECEPLNRATQPFRDEFTQAIINHVQEQTSTTPELKKHLVYCAYHAGGLRFDAIVLQKLVALGYTLEKCIIIEPHTYENTQGTENPITALQKWLTVPVYHYKTTQEYTQACLQNQSLRCNIFVSIDEDRPESIANFSYPEFYTPFFTMLNHCAHDTCLFYFLYYYDVLDYNYRHGILGSYQRTQENNNTPHSSSNIAHWYGEQSLWEHKANFTFTKN